MPSRLWNCGGPAVIEAVELLDARSTPSARTGHAMTHGRPSTGSAERLRYAALVALLFVARDDRFSIVSLSVGYAPLDLRRRSAMPSAASTPSPASCSLSCALPRALLGALVGFSLGITGAAMQGLLRNPLAEPGITGISGAAALGAVIVFYFGLAGIVPLALPLGGIAGAIVGDVPALWACRTRRRHDDADSRRRRDQQLFRRADVARAQPFAQPVSRSPRSCSGCSARSPTAAYTMSWLVLPLMLPAGRC